MTATAIFGLWFVLASEIVPRRLVVPVRITAASVIVLHSISRVWEGVHWVSDTYGGVIWASTMLALLMALRPAIRRLLPGRDGTGPA